MHEYKLYAVYVNVFLVKNSIQFILMNVVHNYIHFYILINILTLTQL
jgi:hypothetical protein